MPDAVLRAAESLSCGLFSLLFPDECRVCGDPLKTISRIPVCASCLKEPQPMAAEFFCVSCKTPFVNRSPLDESGRCLMCREGLSGYDAVYSYGSYEGTLRKLIHVFKFDKVHTLAGPLGALLARSLPREERFDVVVPMPLHWKRRWQRGFNQSELLAREIARRWNVPVEKAVRRVKASTPQAGLSNAKRRKNVAGAFSNANRWRGVVRFVTRWVGERMSRTMRRRLRGFAKPHRLEGKRILLIDDVLTTGATAAACARALKRAGAAHVTLLTVARTDRRFAVHDFLEATSATSGAARIAATAAGAGGNTFE
ncbi:MAG: ComF family protein [Bryobacteraceae bacterium]